MATLLKVPNSVTEFPNADVEACIRDALQEQADTQAILRPPPAGGVAPRPSWEPEIDSLAVIEIICSIEELLGLTLPTSSAPRGGYESVEACVHDLLGAAQAVWIEITEKDDAHA